MLSISENLRLAFQVPMWIQSLGPVCEQLWNSFRSLAQQHLGGMGLSKEREINVEHHEIIADHATQVFSCSSSHRKKTKASTPGVLKPAFLTHSSWFHQKLCRSQQQSLMAYLYCLLFTASPSQRTSPLCQRQMTRIKDKALCTCALNTEPHVSGCVLGRTWSKLSPKS